jgi:histidyl-tRNA synthetase
LEEGGFGAQLKLANKHGARFAVLFGEDELKAGKVVLKDLASGEQTTPAVGELVATIRGKLS